MVELSSPGSQFTVNPNIGQKASGELIFVLTDDSGIKSLQSNPGTVGSTPGGTLSVGTLKHLPNPRSIGQSHVHEPTTGALRSRTTAGRSAPGRFSKTWSLVDVSVPDDGLGIGGCCARNEPSELGALAGCRKASAIAFHAKLTVKASS